MAGKKKTKNRGLIDETEPLDDVLKIESTIKLDNLMLKEKKWTGKFIVGTLLPKSYFKYTVKLTLDEKPYFDRIADLEKGLDDSLFREERTSVRCPEIAFAAMVDQVVYKDRETALTLRVPDDVIEPINKQKFRLEAYKIVLIPLYTPQPTI